MDPPAHSRAHPKYRADHLCRMTDRPQREVPSMPAQSSQESSVSMHPSARSNAHQKRWAHLFSKGAHKISEDYNYASTH